MRYFISKIKLLLAVILTLAFLCCLFGCSRSPASGSTELLDSTQLYFIELGRLVPGFEQPMLDSFREAAEKLDACSRRMMRILRSSGCKGGICAHVQLPDVLEQNLGASGEDGYDLVSFRRIGIPA